jgi:hypothetical protein
LLYAVLNPSDRSLNRAFTYPLLNSDTLPSPVFPQV